MGPYLSQPKREKHTISGQSSSLMYAASEMQGWRNSMEDAHITALDIVADVSLFAVFDGHGGKEVAAYVEKHFIEELKKNKNFQAQQFEAALGEVFLKMDELMVTPQGQKEVLQFKGDSSQGDSYAGCTANVALLHKNTLYVANAGDSRTVLARNGKAEEMSEDHKPDNIGEKTRIEKAGGFVSDGRVNGNLNLSRAMGDLEYKKDTQLKVHEQLIIVVPEVKVMQLQPQDRFMLMGCDGIWETLSNQQLITFVDEKLTKTSTTKDLEQIIEKLLDTLLAPDTSIGTGCDNMTSIIVQFKQLQ